MKVADTRKFNGAVLNYRMSRETLGNYKRLFESYSRDEALNFLLYSFSVAQNYL